MEFFLFLYVDMGVGMVERRQGQSKKKTSKEYVHTDSVGLTVRYTY